MNKKNIKLPNINGFILILGMLLIIVTSFFTFTNRLYKNLDIRTEMYLYEITKESLKLVESKTKELFASLDSMALFVYEYDDIHSKEIVHILDSYSKKNRNSRILVIDKEGKAYSNFGIRYDVKDREYFKEVLKGKPVISQNIISQVDGEEVIVLAVPLYKNGELIGAIASIYTMDVFTQIINVNTFDSEGYSFILKRNGEIVFNPTGIEYQNMFDEMVDIETLSKQERRNVKNNFMKNREGLFKYEYAGKVKYASYAPLGINDWFIVSTIPADIVDKQHNEINKTTVYLILINAICFSILTVYIVSITEKSKKDMRKKALELARITRYMPGGAKRSLADKDFTFLEYTEGFLKLTGYTKEDINILFDNKYINMIYIEDILKVRIIMENQLRSSNQIEAEYRIQKKDGSLIWVLEKGQLTIDEKERKNFYCVIVDITSSKKANQELEYEKEKYKIVADISDDILFEYDVNKDEMIYSEKYIKMMDREIKVSNYIQNLYRSNYVCEEDIRTLVDLFDNVIMGNSSKVAEIRIKNKEGICTWFRVQAIVIRDKVNKTIKIIGKFTDIDKQKRETYKLIEKSQRDFLTNLYNKGATEENIKSFIEEEGKASTHAIMVIDIDDFKGINDNLGHIVGDEVLKIIASKMQKLFRTSDIVGRIGGDEFLVFIKDIISDDVAVQKAEAICNIFRTTYVGENKKYKVSGSVGVSIYPKDGVTYKEIFRKADMALYNVKGAKKDNYKIYDDTLED